MIYCVEELRSVFGRFVFILLLSRECLFLLLKKVCELVFSYVSKAIKQKGIMDVKSLFITIKINNKSKIKIENERV